MTESEQKRIILGDADTGDTAILCLIKDLDLRIVHLEKLVSKTEAKSTWELQIELDRIKNILIEKTVAGNDKPSKYSKSILNKIKKF
jgi:hypothetical protein